MIDESERRPLEKALADLYEKLDRVPGHSSDRGELARFVRRTEAEIFARKHDI